MGNTESQPDVIFHLDSAAGCITVTTKVSEQKIIDADKEVFQLTPDSLELCCKYKFPVQSRLLSPGFAWTNVIRTLRPINARIAKETTKLVSVKDVKHTNLGNITTEYTWTIDRTDKSQTTQKHTWFAEREFKADAKIEYKAAKLGLVEYSNKTTENVETESSEKSSVSTLNHVKVILEPRESVHMEMQATQHTVDIEVDYEARLHGYVDVDFTLAEKKSLIVKDILIMTGKPLTAIYTENFTLKYYTNGDKIIMSNVQNN